MLQENAQTEPARLIRVLLADRRRLYCTGLRKVLEETADIQVIDEAYDVLEAQRMAAEMAPDVVLLTALAPLSRLGEAVSDIQTHCPRAAVLVLARNDERLNLAVLWAAGAAGVVDEAAAPESLVAAIRRANRGELLFTREQLFLAQRQAEEISNRWKDLTHREREISALGDRRAEQRRCVAGPAHRGKDGRAPRKQHPGQAWRIDACGSCIVGDQSGGDVSMN